MDDNSISRLARLTAILTQLQTKRITTATKLASKFNVSIRTVYRDIRTLEQAGVPIVVEDGKGYSLIEGYRVPPVMFSETEANALVTAEHLVLKNRDSSLIREYAAAISKIKAVLQYAIKDKIDLLSTRMAISPLYSKISDTDSLITIQKTITDFNLLEIKYYNKDKNEYTIRQIEPFAIYYSLEENWLVIAYCRLRNDYRMFRLDRISAITQLPIHFKPHKLTLQKFLAEKQKKFETSDIRLS